MRRPMVWVCLLCIFLFAAYRYCYGEEDDKRYYIYGDSLGASGQEASVQGCVDRLEQKKNSYYLYLKKVSVQMEPYQISSNPTQSNQIESNQVSSDSYLSNLLLCFKEEPAVSAGNIIQAKGILQDFEIATNPGQFDARAYYQERNVFYQMYTEEYDIVSGKLDRYRQTLWDLKTRFHSVIIWCLPEKEAGIVTTMLLGDKSALDGDVRELYQQNGIGHLLAISGLHISILCMAFYHLLLFLRFPRKAAVFLTLFVLYSYGELSGFSLSANRAIIMMILYLLAGVLGKSYDLLSAMAFSALLILLQKPFAITSCSFLLSYAAILGVGVIYPVLQECVYGDEKMRRKRKRKSHRLERELKAQGTIGICKWWMLQGMNGLIQTLLMSVAIQISTLPVMLYFYYEVPTYGVILNILVLPLASLLVTLAALAVVLGLFFLPFAKFIFGTVVLILRFYEWLCGLFLHLPMPVSLIGRPEEWRIVVYVLLVFIAVALSVWVLKKNQQLPLYLWSLATLILIFPSLNPAFSISFLDVGQGDGIVMQCMDGTTFLIDGGSSSEKNVGEYRITPCLKYLGIGKIDYMIVSHADSDHISGQMELLEQCGEAGKIQIGQLILPEPALEYQEEEGFQQMLSLAESVHVPVQYIHSGDVLQLSHLKIRCLHPDIGFDGDSANAYSTTLDISYDSFRMLLCGDLEGSGEEIVLERLQQDESLAEHPLSVLKVAHHGSKNSTSEELLEVLRPQMSVISCGRNNRYKHPHPELLERLEACGSLIYQTQESGAITVGIQGGEVSVEEFLR